MNHVKIHSENISGVMSLWGKTLYFWTSTENQSEKNCNTEYWNWQNTNCSKFLSFLWESWSTWSTSTHTHAHTHLWRRRRTHLHCSFSIVKANQSFRTDVQLLAHVPFGGGPSECLWREICRSRSFWSVTKATAQCSFNIQARNVPNLVWRHTNDTRRSLSEQICCLINDSKWTLDFSLRLCLALLREAN